MKKSKKEKIKIQENVSLKKYSTFKIGGPARYFVVAEKLEELIFALNWAAENKLKFFILGGGSNVLFPDKGFDGLVIKLSNRELEILKNGESDNLANESEKNRKVQILSGAGAGLMELVKFAQKNSLTGLEWAAGIPGTVGGAIRGNAGAFGGEIKDQFQKAQVLDLSRLINLEELKNSKGEIKPETILTEFDGPASKFSYRESIFKKNRNLVIWSGVFNLEPGRAKEIDAKIQELLQKRKSNQPSLGEFPSIGSIFKNPQASQKVIQEFEHDKEVKARDQKVPAGWLIDRAGLKGKQIGGALVSPIQANFIVNSKNATAEDVLILMSLIKAKVRNQFGVQLEEEVEVVS